MSSLSSPCLYSELADCMRYVATPRRLALLSPAGSTITRRSIGLSALISFTNEGGACMVRCAQQVIASFRKAM